MGCNINKKAHQQHKSQSKQMMIDNQKIIYKQVSLDWKFMHPKGSIEFVEIQGHVYLLQWDVNQCFNIYNLDTGKENKFSLQGIIKKFVAERKKLFVITSQRLYQFQIIDDQVNLFRYTTFYNKISKKCSAYQIYYEKNLILWRINNQLQIVKLGMCMKPKVVFQIKNAPFQQNELVYSKQRGVLAYCPSQQYIEIFDIISKLRMQVNIRKPNNSLIQIKYMRIVENNIELLLQISDMGLILNKINYLNGIIEDTKYLYYDVRELQILEDHNTLVLQTQNYYMKFDKDYNISQKFEIILKKNICRNLTLHRVFFNKLRNYLILIYQFDENDMNLEIYEQRDDIRFGQIILREVKNYVLEQGSDPQISQNQHYLVIGHEHLLILYQIEQKLEKQLLFDNKIKFLGFGANSCGLYVSIRNMIICLNCQHMKLKHRWIYRDDKFSKRDIYTRQNGIITVIDSEGIKVCRIQPNKQIFRLKHKINYNHQHDYWNSSNRLMIFNGREIVIYILSDRKHLILNIDHQDCRLSQNEQQLIIVRKLRDEGQLQLWHLNPYDAVFQRPIMNKVRFFYKNCQDQVIIKNYQRQVIILDKNLELVQKIHKVFPIHLITQNYILFEKKFNFSHSNAYSLVQRIVKI